MENFPFHQEIVNDKRLRTFSPDVDDDEPEVAAPEQSEASKFGDILIKNLVDSFNFVQIAKDTVAAVASGWKSLFGGKDDKKIETNVSSGSAPASKPATSATTESKPSVTASPATQVSAPASAVPEPPKPVTTGASLQQTSETVVAEKKDQASAGGDVLITNVNNQTVIVAQEDKKPESKVVTTSTSVGR